MHIRAQKNKKKRKKTLYSKTENQYVVRAVSYKKKQSFADVHLQIGNNMRTTYKMAVTLVVLAASLQAALAQSEVYSVNVVGFQKATSPTGLVMKSNPFQGMVIRDVVGNNGLYTTGTDPTLADNVLLFDSASQQYVTYYLRSHSSIGRPEWRSGSTWGTNVYINPGQGAFYRNRLTASRTNVVAGDVVIADAVTNVVKQGLQIFSYPFATSRKLTDINLKNGLYTTGTDPAAADNVMLFDSITKQYTTYYLRSHSSLGRPEWRSGTVWGTNVVVDAGQSFWFRSRIVSDYNWVETTPYPDL